MHRPVKLIRDLANILSRLNALDERSADTQIELRQLASLLSIRDELPAIPPKHLQLRVAGAYKANFFEAGHEMIREIECISNSNGESFLGSSNILDFGCGCGRILIPLSFLVPPGRLSGTDIDKHAIRWLDANGPPFKDLTVNPVKPPTKYDDATFDFVLALSVFTHLPEKMQRKWLGELSRIMKPGGLGLFTTHGEKQYAKLSEPALQELRTGGFHYSVGDATEGLPEFYQTSFQTHDYIKREWARYFDIVDIQKQGIANNQDAVLVRKRL